MSGFKRATKAQAKLRAAFFGPSGAGKTYSALRVATGMGGAIAFIDTEGAVHERPDGSVEEISSASKYADRFEFDVLNLRDKSIDGYVEAISKAAAAGYQILVIDSMTHAWQELTAEVDRLAKAKYKGNTWSAWSEGTPLQRRLVGAILGFPGHVIATMRSKTEWTTVDNNGKKTPQRVGLAPEQGKGVEYEFDLLVEISTEHIANVIKDRTGKFQDKLIEKPDEKFGKALAAWLADGEPASSVPLPTQRAAVEPGLFDQIAEYIRGAKTVRTLGKIGDRIDVLTSEGELDTVQVAELMGMVNARHQEIQPQEVTNGVA